MFTLSFKNCIFSPSNTQNTIEYFKYLNNPFVLFNIGSGFFATSVFVKEKTKTQTCLRFKSKYNSVKNSGMCQQKKNILFSQNNRVSSKIVDEINFKIASKKNGFKFLSTNMESINGKNYIGYVDELNGRFELFGKISAPTFVYIGEFMFGKKCGYGTEITFDSFGNIISQYDGYWSEDCFTFGKFTCKETTYIGSFKNNGFCGYGEVCLSKKMLIYNAFWSMGKITCFYSITDEYSSINFLWYNLNSKKILVGFLFNKIFKNLPPKYYIGEYNTSGNFHGYGIYFKNGRVKYIGEWLEGKKHGYGTLYNRFGGFKYSGDFKNNLYNGHGLEKSYNCFFFGKFKNNLKNGCVRKYSDIYF